MNQIGSYQHIFTDEARERLGSAHQPTGQGLVALVRAGATVWNQWIADYPREEIVFSDIVFNEQDAQVDELGYNPKHMLDFQGFVFSEGIPRVVFKQIRFEGNSNRLCVRNLSGIISLCFEDIDKNPNDKQVSISIENSHIRGYFNISRCKNTSFSITNSSFGAVSRVYDCELNFSSASNSSFSDLDINNTKLLGDSISPAIYLADVQIGGSFVLKQVELDLMRCLRCDFKGQWFLENEPIDKPIKRIDFSGCRFDKSFYLDAEIDIALTFNTDQPSPGKTHGWDRNPSGRICEFANAPQLKIPDMRFHLVFDPSCVFPKATGSGDNASAYRTIKQFYSEQDSRSQEFRFFCLEMSEERLQISWRRQFLKRLAFHLYWLSSDYGNSLVRPLLLIFSTALLTMVLAHRDQIARSPSAFDWATTRGYLSEMLQLLWPLDLKVDGYGASKIIAKFIISLGWFLFALGLRNLLKLRA